MKKPKGRRREANKQVSVKMKQAAVLGLVLVLACLVALVGCAPRPASENTREVEWRGSWAASWTPSSINTQAGSTEAVRPPAGHQRQRHQHRRPTRRRAREGLRERKVRLLKRQAAELAVSRLHILESLDEQLVAFAELASRRTWPGLGGGQQVCTLRLPPLANRTSGEGRHLASQMQDDDDEHDYYVRSSTCLSDARLRRHIPPYMLNLYRQLLAELAHLRPVVGQVEATFPRSSSQLSSANDQDDAADADAADATNNDDNHHERHSNDQFSVPTLPYNAQIMRSFRQPTINYYDQHEEHDGDDDEQNYDGHQQALNNNNELTPSKGKFTSGRVCFAGPRISSIDQVGASEVAAQFLSAMEAAEAVEVVDAASAANDDDLLCVTVKFRWLEWLRFWSGEPDVCLWSRKTRNGAWRPHR